MLLLDGSSFTIGEVDENSSVTQLLLSQHTPACLVLTVYSIEPTPIPMFTPVCEIFTPKSRVFPRARKKVSNSADLGAKEADPAVISLWKALKKLPPLRLPYPKCRPVITSMSEFHPVMTAAPETSFKMAIVHKTSSKMAAAHVPLGVLVEYDVISWSPDMAPVPELSSELTSTHEYSPMKTPAPECSLESVPECSPELNQEPTHITELNQEPSSPSPLVQPSFVSAGLRQFLCKS